MRCGAQFRKPISQISDRAKRYRAHSPGCEPSGPKRCFKCGSRRNVVPDHIDGDESNGRRSNLRWACKRHNTILGKRMAKAGKGVRTRQYNPGAVNLAQYVQAAMDHVRGSHDAGGKIIHETPKAIRRQFAREIWFRRGYRGNPPQDIMPEFWAGKLKDSHGRKVTDLKTARAILLSELRALGKIPPRKNPGEADDLYRSFHGRGPDKILTLIREGLDPYSNHPELAQLGPLIRMIVGEGVELGGDYGDTVTKADWVKEISFVPDVNKWHKWLETENPSVSRAKGYLATMRVPDLAAVPGRDRKDRSRGRQLYIVGGNQNADPYLAELGVDPDKDLLDLGNVYLVEYFTQKRFDRFDPINYWHHLGEVSKEFPRLLYWRKQHILWLAGGAYYVTSRGIEN